MTWHQVSDHGAIRVLSNSDAVRIVELNRPSSLNALTAQTLSDLAEVYTKLSAEPQVRVVVLRGVGRCFCAGADINDPPGNRVGAPSESDRVTAARAGEYAVTAIRQARPVTIARIHGHAIGGGLLLAVANDFRVAEQRTVFRLPEVPSGIPLTWGGTPLLAGEIGASAARELIMFGASLHAEEARRIGLVHSVCPGVAALDAEVDRRVSELAQLPQPAVDATKDQFRRLKQCDNSTEQQRLAEARLYTELLPEEWNPRE